MADLRRHVGRRVIVLLEDSSIDGTLTRADSIALELEHAQAIPEQGQPVPIDGAVVVPMARVLWMQVP